MSSKRILAFLVPAIVVAALAVALSGGTPSQARESSSPSTQPVQSQATNPTKVFECFRVDASSDQPGADAKATVRLVTENFGGKLVRVRKLVAMCELAYKFPPPPAGVPDEVFPPTDADVRVFACYQVQRGQDPNDPFVLATQNFGKDTVQVRASQQMCEEAAKIRTDAAGNTTTVGQPSGVVWQCFNLDKAKSINQKFRVVTNNFGRDDAFVVKGAQLCEEARKDRITASGEVTHSGEATGRVVECFRLESKLDPKAKVTLITKNFGAVDVLVRRATQMCEPGEKTPVYTLPNDPALDQPGDD
ncbi:MAG TPA: hypothetical protein PLX85_00300 [Dehalococcoidia bacterium]|nr:hypothetical protein [Dehalococcoidia bacterium]